MSVAQTAVARVIGIDVNFKDFNLGKAVYLPQRLTMIGQGSSAVTYDGEKTLLNSAVDAGEKFGYGSPIHLAARQFFPDNGDGIKGIPISVIGVDDDDSGVAAAGDLTATGTATAQGVCYVKIGGIQSNTISFAVGDAAAAIAADLKAAIDAIVNMPALSGALSVATIPLTSKWKGESANDITIEFFATQDTGIVFSSTAFASGAVNPDIDPALLKIGDVWESMILNLLNYDDTATLAKYATWNEGRWIGTIRRPAVVGVGCVANFATRTAISSARTTDRTNFLIQNTGSKELPFAIAARGFVKNILQRANDTITQNYNGSMTGLVAGDDTAQEDDTTKDNAVKLGASTNAKVDTYATQDNIVTFYTGNKSEYRYVRDIVLLQNISFNQDVILVGLSANPLFPDTTATTDPNAVKPKTLKTLFKRLATDLAEGKRGILAEKEFTIDNMEASISSTNAKRLDGRFPCKISGTAEIISVDVDWGFYFGV